MSTKLCLMLIFIFTVLVAGAQNAVLKGQVIDGKTKAALASAYVHFEEKKGDVLTDAFGLFLIAFY